MPYDQHSRLLDISISFASFTMFLFVFVRAFLLLVLVETAFSLIITSVLAGRKKFKTFSFDYLLPPIVIEKPNKLQMSYNGHWTLKKPNFRIKFNMPIKMPLQLHYGDNYEEPDHQEIDNSADNGDQYVDGPSDNNYDQEDQTYHDSEDSLSYENQDQETDSQLQKPKEPQFKIHGSPSIKLLGSVNLNHENKLSDSYRKIQLGEKTPYTGKAQVSSFIDNGHLVNAQHQSPVIASSGQANGGLIDAAFGDQLDGSYAALTKPVTDNNQEMPAISGNVLPVNLQAIGKKSELANREDIRRHKAHAAMKIMALKKMKMLKVPLLAKKLVLHNSKSHIHTVRLGYKFTPPEISYITTYENMPDAVPLSVPLPALGKYYTSMSFTNGLRAIPYEPADFGPLGTLKYLFKLGKAPKLLVPLKAAKMIKYKG